MYSGSVVLFILKAYCTQLFSYWILLWLEACCGLKLFFYFSFALYSRLCYVKLSCTFQCSCKMYILTTRTKYILSPTLCSFSQNSISKLLWSRFFQRKMSTCYHCKYCFYNAYQHSPWKYVEIVSFLFLISVLSYFHHQYLILIHDRFFVSFDFHC